MGSKVPEVICGLTMSSCTEEHFKAPVTGLPQVREFWKGMSVATLNKPPPLILDPCDKFHPPYRRIHRLWTQLRVSSKFIPTVFSANDQNLICVSCILFGSWVHNTATFLEVLLKYFAKHMTSKINKFLINLFNWPLPIGAFQDQCKQW